MSEAKTMAEDWMPVFGYEGLYEVSNLGTVRSARTGKPLKDNETDRYSRVKLYKNLKGKCFMIHRLVASAFCENPDGKPFVNHIDGDRKNNKASNLEWCTASENEIHAHKMGLNSVEPMLCKTRKPVEQRDWGGRLIKRWDSMSQAARSLGLDVSGISFCCSGRTKSCGGYRWDVGA